MRESWLGTPRCHDLGLGTHLAHIPDDIDLFRSLHCPEVADHRPQHFLVSFESGNVLLFWLVRSDLGVSVLARIEVDTGGVRLFDIRPQLMGKEHFVHFVTFLKLGSALDKHP